VLCEPSAAPTLKNALAQLPGVLRVLESGPGPDADLCDEAAS
jgi:hypothetical protein